MKSVTVAALAELTKEQGTEPLIIVGIEWVSGSTTFYSDKSISGIDARILDISTIDSVVVDNKTTSSVNLTLDDTDSAIKNIIDSYNIHKVHCFVYQYYGALSDLADKFLLFQGQISTPFTWDEKNRSISFSIVSEIESFEVGFSPEEGQLPFVRLEDVGKPWPLCFGNVVQIPAQRLTQAQEGSLMDTICILDPVLPYKLEALRTAYYQEAFLAAFYTKVANGAEQIAGSVQAVLQPYISIIKQERAIMLTISQVTQQLDRFRSFKAGGARFVAVNIANLEQQLDQLAIQSNIIHLQKAYLERQVALLDFKYRMQKDAFEKITQAYNDMQTIYNEYIQVQQEICTEEQCVVNQVRIEGGELFPQGTLTEVYLKDVKLRGTFSGQTFTFLEAPMPKYFNLEVDTWQRDDSSCAPQDSSNGINMFWLKDNPPENLVGLFLLVQKKGEPDNYRHIIKVERQVGRKVYFKLTPWEFMQGDGPPRGLSIDDQIGKMASTPFVPTQWGGAVPVDLFNGNWDVSAWNQPEGIFLLNLINQIPGGVNQYELELLGKLVFLLPSDNMNGFSVDQPDARRTYTVIGEDIFNVQAACGFIPIDWLNYTHAAEEIPETLYWQANIGDVIRTEPDNCSIYIANILPSTIKAVHAYRTLPTGSRVLTPVPSSYYVKNESANLGTITVTSVTFPCSLKDIPGEQWEDDVYVTLSSSVGPNVCDIIQWLVETYTSLSVNAANFAAIKAKFQDGSGNELYPANFPILDRPNVLDEISRIAWEARCAIYRVGNEFFLKYLAEEPTEDMTFTEDDVSSEDNLAIVFPQTEGLVTRMIATWKQHYLPLQQGQRDPRVVLRNNVKLYGLHEESTFFHIYNNKDLVYKSATFWMIRRSNTWKHLQFKTFLTKIQLDAFDTILFDFTKAFISNGSIKGVLNVVNYDPANNLLVIDAELPIRAGEMDIYPYYWPASLPAGTEWPTAFEIEQGYAGGYGPGSGVKGTIDDC